MECAFIDFRKIVKNKLSQESEKHPLIAVFVDHRYAVVGELAQRLKIPLADILFGHASIDKTGQMVCLRSIPRGLSPPPLDPWA